MDIHKITDNKKEFIELLLLGDEQESMIDKYLDAGDMYVMYDKKPVAQCVVLNLGDGIYELKNISVSPEYQGKGIGSGLIGFISETYKSSGKELIVGTGENPDTLAFYQKNGFSYYKRIKNFFTDNYDHPIYENGIMLQDMVYLKRKF